VECVIKIQNIQINEATTKQKHKNKTTKPETNTFSKYCEDKTKRKKFNTKYTHIMQAKEQFTHIMSQF
jgi:hypothetical protein